MELPHEKPVTPPHRKSQSEIRTAIQLDWRWRSDREIAKSLGVSNSTVSRCRREMEAEGLIVPRLANRTPAPGHGEQGCVAADRTPARGHGETSCVLYLRAILPAWENDTLYAPVDTSTDSFVALREDIRKNGILEPIVVSSDGYILSGHRRFAAATALNMSKIPVRVRHDISSRENPEQFFQLLASFNRQRVKTTAEQTREEVALSNPDARQQVWQYRQTTSQVDAVPIKLGSRKRRSQITDKCEFRDALVEVVVQARKDWPLSDREVFYRLLNVPGMVRNDKSRTPFLNNEASYKDVTNLLTRLRLDYTIPFDAIADDTRPVVIWDAHAAVGDFVRREVDQFLKGYHRNLMLSQPNWVEFLVEKNTVASHLSQLAAKYTIPMTSGRGYSSLPPRKLMVDRFTASGKDKLVLIVVSDFDPEGEDIPAAFGRSLRDDFYIDEDQLVVVKAALTHDHVQQMDLHEGQQSKETSSRYKRFAEKYGERCWELESLTPDQLRATVEDVIRQVIDLETFDAELATERVEQIELIQQRKQLVGSLKTDCK